MSSFKKNTLAAALVLGMGLAGGAFAYTLGTGPTASPGDQNPEKIATADIVDATTVIALTDATWVRIQATDNIIGRTTGFGMRLKLDNGAEFAPGIAANLALEPTLAAAGWTLTVAAGDGTGTLVLSIVPPNGGTLGVPEGNLLTIAGGNVTGLDHLTALQLAGQRISLTTEFYDPVTTNPILTTKTTPLLESGNPLDLACDPDNGDTLKRIDVGSDANQATKTYFSSNGAIGDLDSGYFNAGTVEVGVKTGFTFAYDPANDEFSTVISGVFPAFDVAGNSVFLSVNNDCSTNDVTGSLNAANTQATFDYVLNDIGGGTTGGSAYLCFEVASGNDTVIDASTISAVTSFTRDDFEYTSGSCSLLPLQYNGSVVRVYNVNPAGNTTAESFIRVINPSGVTGKVTIVGWDDNGNKRGPLTFNLAARNSRQINSQDIEAGNPAKLTGAFGDGAGKWRLEVTGEFAGMRVSSLNRNSTDGTVTNLTDADGHGEQAWEMNFDGG